jgi:nucleoside-diphosphate-sugar epimerase
VDVFITGAGGYVGGAVTERLIAAGHTVTALARSDAAAAAVEKLGAAALRGALTDTDVLHRAAVDAAAVVHTAIDYGDPDFHEQERVALDALLDAGAGTRLVYTSTTFAHGDTGPEPVSEDHVGDPDFQPFKVTGERRVLESTDVVGTVVRPGSVYGRGGGLATRLVAAARAQGVSTYVGDGSARWSQVHVDDLADLYVRILGADGPGGVLHAVEEAAPSMREIAEAVGRNVGVPARSITVEQAAQALGPFAVQLTRNLWVTPSRARAGLGWNPTSQGLLHDIEHGSYRTT